MSEDEQIWYGDDARLTSRYLRDQFAMAAMNGLLASGRERNDTIIAAAAYRLADAMMKARDEELER